jgi:glycosyltransferase involved in cell wall biosynthesis
MASGLPSLYHPSGGSPELLGDAGIALSETLADDVARVLATPAVWRARALERAPRFFAERAATDYAAVVREAVAASAAAPARTRRIWSRLGY